MTLSLKYAALAVFLLALATILGALGYQFIGGYPPCHLCLIERYAYYFAVPASLIAFLVMPRQAAFTRTILFLIALAFLANTVLGIYHFGVEQTWWKGPSSCTGGGASTDWRELAEQLKHTAVVRCDEASIFILGLSLSFWNAVASALLCVIAALGAIGGRRTA